MRHLSSQYFYLWMVESQRAEAQYKAPERGSCRKSLGEWSKKIFEKIRIQSTVRNVTFSIRSQSLGQARSSGATRFFFGLIQDL